MSENPERSFTAASPRISQADHEQRRRFLRVVLLAVVVAIAAVVLAIVVVLGRHTVDSSASQSAAREEAPGAFPRQLLPKRFEVIESLDMGHRGIGDEQVGAVAYVRDPATGNCFLAAEQFVENDFQDSNVAYTSVSCPTPPRAYHGD